MSQTFLSPGSRRPQRITTAVKANVEGQFARTPKLAKFLAVSAAVLSFQLAPSAWAVEIQVVHDSAPAVPLHLQPIENMRGNDRLDLVIALPLRNREGLTNLLREICDPSSPNFRRYLTPEQFAEQFGPTEKDYETVTAFAKSNGLTITGTHPNRTLVDVSATVGNIEKAFQVKLHVYQHPKEARTFYAADAEPSVNLAIPILSISGLDNFVLPRPMGIRTSFFDRAPSTTPYATGSGPRGNFIGRDFRMAYAPNVPWDGGGEAVGLFELDGYYSSDIVAYENLAGLPNVQLTNVVLNGFSGPPGINNIEVALDIDMVISMAPGLSKLIVYEGIAPNDVLNRMATDNQARQLSSSWGFGPQIDPAREQIFMQFAAQGQSYFQASGDGGAWTGTIFPPSDDPYATVVGGTFLTISNLTGAWLSETTWPGSGGGISPVYPIPGWQQGINMSANQGSSLMRNIPDVACMADEAIWVIVNNGEQGFVGGTSAAAPLWAGFMALANQKGAALSKPSIGFVNPALYAVGQSSSYTQAFHDITTGNNTNATSSNKFLAVQGYDLCTGWGTPTGEPLIDALLAPTDALQITPEARLNFSGSPGGPFNPSMQTFSLTNAGTHPLTWVLSSSAPWFSMTPSNGILGAGAPDLSINVTLTAAANTLPAGNYSATIAFTNVISGLVQSREVILNVSVLPVIVSQPANQAVFEGMSAIFTVGTATNGFLSYQWRRDNGAFQTNLTDSGNLFGSASNTLVINNVSSANVGAYSVVVSNAQGAAISSNAFLTILPWRPIIVTQPTNRTALPGEVVTLSLKAVGTQPLVYQWQKNGVNLTDGADLLGSSTMNLRISNIAVADAGSYSVIVSNTFGTAISSNAILSVAAATAPGVSMATLYSLTGGEEGANPNGLLLVSNSTFYGTTQNGGTNQAGTIFRLTTNGLFASLYSFTGGNDGANPFAALAPGPDGNFYGTAFQGGASRNGTIFRMTPAGLLSTLVTFNIGNGDFPYAQLMLGADSNFYGTCYQGGAFGRGTVFRVATNGTFATLFAFSNGTDGGHLAGGLVQAADGSLYGTTYKGGALGFGTVFQLNLNGQLTKLFSFGSTNGAFPVAGLARGTDGNFYGVTTSGGLYNEGTVFRITPAGQFTNLYAFSGGSDGSNPRASLLLAADGNFYGTTSDGGVYGQGTAFVLSPDGALIMLIQFDGFNGANPQATLVQGADSTFYGTTRNGGANGQGTIFRFGTSFSPQITSQPGNQSVFVGATVSFNVSVLGGVPLFYHWQKNGIDLADGGNISGSHSRILTLTNVALSDAGSYSVIVSNSSSTATSASALLAVTSSPPYFVSQPINQTLAPGATATLAVTALGNLPLSYRWQRNGINLADGGTVSGSSSNVLTLTNVTETNNGTYVVVATNALGSVSSTGALLTVVPMSAPGTRVTTLHWFKLNGPDGDTPNGLARGTNGILYGTSPSGGAFHNGTAFSLTTNGTFTTLVSFQGTNGSSPQAALLQGTDGNFYGTTQQGGTNDLGSVFRMTPAGMVTVLHSFDADISSPYTALAQDAEGNFYGVAGDFTGNIFKFTPNGLFTNLYTFADGDRPVDALASGADGNFYGMLSQGGIFDNGAIFRMSFNGSLTNIYSFTGGPDGLLPAGSLMPGGDGALYGTTKSSTTNFGGTAFEYGGTVFRITAVSGFTTVCRFPSGVQPWAGVIYSSDGNFYGTTHGSDSGPINQGPSAIINGTVFRLTPNGSLSTLLEFDGFNDGARPETSLLEGPDGSLYGTTSIGGPGGHGTIFKLSFTTAPQITTQPTNQTAVAGANVSFSVAVFGAPPLSYQWRKNGNNLTDNTSVSGSTSRILNLINVSLADQATYSVVVSNALGSVTSFNALLTILSPPVFRSIGQTGGIVTLTWTAIAQQTYQLQSNTNLNSTNWSNLGNAITATNNTVIFSDVMASHPQRFYRAILLR
jgi:uncharacterized repeat protein (TIGR03803 family)